MKHKAVCNSRLNECESASTKLVPASLRLERRPVTERERKEGGGGGGVREFLSQERINGWERESREGEEWKGEKERGGGVTVED